MGENMHKHMACKLLIVGIVLILVRLYTSWDMWIVIGALLVIKSLIMFSGKGKCCEPAKKGKK